MRKLLIPMAVLLLLTVAMGPLMDPRPASAAGAIIYVDVNVTGGSDNGNSWANAFDTLQEGLDAATSDDEIWVARGTYKPTVEHGGTGDRFQSFQMKNGVGIYGGFDGTETLRSTRDWKNNTTTLSGDIGTEGDSSDNCYHVFYHPSGINLDSSAVLDGFTITAGNTGYDGSDHTVIGGGMCNEYQSSPTLINCSFSGNFGYLGGGIGNYEQSSPILTNCIFSGNSAAFGGGMANYVQSSPTLTNCIFSGNSANVLGGGMSNHLQSSPTLTNCSFSGNSATSHGGGGVCSSGQSSPILINCILWGNSTEGSGSEVFDYDGDSPPIFYYCDIKGSGGSTSWDISLGTDGGNNIDANPLFVDEVRGDLHLNTGSSCIDSGNNNAVLGISTDFDGNSRIIDNGDDGTDIVDIGAYEHNRYPIVRVGREAQPVSTADVLVLCLGLPAAMAVGTTIALKHRRACN